MSDYDIIREALKYASDWGDLVGAPHEWPEVRAALSRLEAREREDDASITRLSETNIRQLKKLERYERALREIADDGEQFFRHGGAVARAECLRFGSIARAALSEPSQGESLDCYQAGRVPCSECEHGRSPCLNPSQGEPR